VAPRLESARETLVADEGLDTMSEEGDELRAWLAKRPHTAECRCKGCRARRLEEEAAKLRGALVQRAIDGKDGET